MTFRARWLLVIIILTPLVAACGNSNTSNVTLKLAPIADLPAEIQQAPPEVRDAYRFALANPDILEKIPCYCGCGGAPHGHMNNADCYVDQVRPDGTVAFDGHAFT